MTVEHDHDLLTKQETADWLRVSVRTLERYIEAGSLPVVRLPGGTVRIRRTDIQVLIGAFHAALPQP